jgi:hypothetical protein
MRSGACTPPSTPRVPRCPIYYSYHIIVRTSIGTCFPCHVFVGEGRDEGVCVLKNKKKRKRKIISGKNTWPGSALSSSFGAAGLVRVVTRELRAALPRRR